MRSLRSQAADRAIFLSPWWHGAGYCLSRHMFPGCSSQKSMIGCHMPIVFTAAHEYKQLSPAFILGSCMDMRHCCARRWDLKFPNYPTGFMGKPQERSPKSPQELAENASGRYVQLLLPTTAMQIRCE